MGTVVQRSLTRARRQARFEDWWAWTPPGAPRGTEGVTPARPFSSRRSSALVGITALALAYASLAQSAGWNQNAHYALVRALTNGTAIVDPYRHQTGDVSWFQGHYYAAKAPGLAFATVPVYFLLDALAVKEVVAKAAPGATDRTVGMLWVLGLAGCVLPATAIALLVRRLADLVEPGLGLLAAVSAGLGTLLLPFSTLFFAHVLAAGLAFAAFAVLWLRSAPALAGLLAGLAVTVDYPLALAAVILGGYARRRAPLYFLGVAFGIVPLLAYQWWAFGSPTHLAYHNAVFMGGVSGHDVVGANERGFFGVALPSFVVGVELLFSPPGLLRMTPLVALGVVGTVLMYRRGFRAEAVTIATVAFAYLIYNAGYVLPFGGAVPGPRFLIPALPFLAVPLALAFRRLPLTTLTAAGASAALMAAVTVTNPMDAFLGVGWDDRILAGSFGIHSLPSVAAFLLFAVVAATFALRAASLEIRCAELPVVLVGGAAWALLFVLGPPEKEGWSVELAVAVAVLAAVAVLLTLAVGLRGPLRRRSPAALE